MITVMKSLMKKKKQLQNMYVHELSHLKFLKSFVELLNTKKLNSG